MIAAPRCPIHKTEMVSATRWIRVNGRPFPAPIHVCEVAGCRYAHDARGYRQITESEPVGQPLTAVLARFRLFGR
jgi:hypothetical protein